MKYIPKIDDHRQNRRKPVDILARHIADFYDDVHGEITAEPLPETEKQLARFLLDLGYRQVTP